MAGWKPLGVCHRDRRVVDIAELQCLLPGRGRHTAFDGPIVDSLSFDTIEMEAVATLGVGALANDGDLREHTESGIWEVNEWLGVEVMRFNPYSLLQDGAS